MYSGWEWLAFVVISSRSSRSKLVDMSLKINFNELHSYDELISFFAEIFQPFLVICSSQENSRLLPFFVAYEILCLWFEHMLASDVITHVVHQTQSDMSYIRHIIRMSSSDRSYLISGCLCDIPSRRFLRFIGISKKIVTIELIKIVTIVTTDVPFPRN